MSSVTCRQLPVGEGDLAAVRTPGGSLRLERGQRFGGSAVRRGGRQEDPVVLALEHDLAARARRRGIGVAHESGEPGAPATADAAHPEVEEAALARNPVDHPLPVRRESDASEGFLIVEERFGRGTGQMQVLALSGVDEARDLSVGRPGREGQAVAAGLRRRVPAGGVEDPESRNAVGPGHPGDCGAVHGPAQLAQRPGCRRGVRRAIGPQRTPAAVGPVVDPPLLAAVVEDVLVNQHPAAVREPGQVADGRRARAETLRRPSRSRGEADLTPLQRDQPVPVRRNGSHRVAVGDRTGLIGGGEIVKRWERSPLGTVGSAGDEEENRDTADVTKPAHGGIVWAEEGRCSCGAPCRGSASTVSRPCRPGWRPPPGETHMIGSARSPRPHERVVRHSRWQGPASSARVSRSRACRPEVGVPSRPRPSARWALRSSAALRAAVPGPTGRTAQRSAFPCPRPVRAGSDTPPAGLRPAVPV